jgi:hypothetical protein
LPTVFALAGDSTMTNLEMGDWKEIGDLIVFAFRFMIGDSGLSPD